MSMVLDWFHNKASGISQGGLRHLAGLQHGRDGYSHSCCAALLVTQPPARYPAHPVFRHRICKVARTTEKFGQAARKPFVHFGLSFELICKAAAKTSEKDWPSSTDGFFAYFGKTMISMGVALSDCLPCPMRSRCMRAKGQACSLLVHGQAEHVALHQRRAEQQTEALLALYHQRAGIEGTLSQGVRAFGLRVARYRGRAKTHVQDVATATAINIYHLSDWWRGRPRAQTRRSSFAALAPAS